MANQIYFVVCVDLETGEVSFDHDTADTRFPDGLVWNHDTNEWQAETEDEFQMGYDRIRPIVYPDN